MNKAKWLVALSVAVCAGCEKRELPADVSRRIDDSVSAVRGEVSFDIPVVSQSIDVAEAIYRLSDRQEQVSCFETWLNRLLSVETRTMGTRALGDYLNNAHNVFFTSIAFGLEQVHAAPEVLLDAHIRLVVRLKEELDRIRPKRKRDRDLAARDADSVRRYEEWRKCYLTISRLHRLCLDRLEEHDFNDIAKGLPPDRRAALRKRLEGFLGRALRTKDAIRAGRSVKGEEYESVLSRQVEP